MNEDLQRSILELQLRRTELVEELKEINLQIKFLREQLESEWHIGFVILTEAPKVFQ